MFNPRRSVMSKTAFVFPGQGSQSVGMGKDFYEHPAGKNIFETFDRIVTPDQTPALSEICFNGPEAELRRTLYTQPAILATSLAALELFRQRCALKPVVAAGHSLGEYGALYAAGVISLKTAAGLVKRRAELMENAPKGAMSAVLGLDGQVVEKLVAEYQAQHQAVVVVANYNTDNQVVISGQPDAVAGVGDVLKQAGAKRVLPLPVGGAFHSPLMKEAAAEFLADFELNNAAFPVVTNVDASDTTDKEAFRRKLGAQIDGSVRWTQTMQRMITEHGVDTVIEFGPGKVLTGMFKKMFPEVKVYNVLDMASLEAVAEELASTAAVSA
jgi:[acyl-carrier-protein] S-malonyltransferase